MLFTLRMGLMGLHFVVAGILGLVIGICRPFNPDNSRLCARLYSMPALRILRLNLQRDAKGLLEHQRSCVIIANHQSNYDLYVLGRVVPERRISCCALRSKPTSTAKCQRGYQSKARFCNTRTGLPAATSASRASRRGARG